LERQNEEEDSLFGEKLEGPILRLWRGTGRATTKHKYHCKLRKQVLNLGPKKKSSDKAKESAAV
jgi:hypothetical protein